MPSQFLTPFGSERGLPSFGRLQQEMNRLFEDFLPAARGGEIFAPDMDVTENDKEIRVTAELPGVEEKDVSVSLDNDLLVIRGEKRAERTEEKENYHFSERTFGSFQRALRLPAHVDSSKVEARFDKGVLTVTAPKDQTQAAAQKIEVKSGK